MRKCIKRNGSNILILFGLLGILAAFSYGCTAPQQTTEFKSIGAAETTVNAAYGAYLDGVMKGTIATNSFPRVAQSYNAFQNVANTAVVLHGLNPTNLPPAELSQLAVNVLALIQLAQGK